MEEKPIQGVLSPMISYVYFEANRQAYIWLDWGLRPCRKVVLKDFPLCGTLVTNSMCQSSKSFLGPRMCSKTVRLPSVNKPSTISASSDTWRWNKGRDCMAGERIAGAYPRDAAGNSKGRH